MIEHLNLSLKLGVTAISSRFYTRTAPDTPSKRLHTGVSAAVFILGPLLIPLISGFYSKSYRLTSIYATPIY
jgi:hypothetical protein